MEPRFFTADAASCRRRYPTGPDVLFITADAAVDHPSFPASLLIRVIEAAGFTAAMVPRPAPDAPEALAAYGRPRLCVAISGGALDSMVANYTAQKRRRHDDPYAPGGAAGGRPDRAVTVYTQLARRAFGKAVPIVVGGVEASLRAFAHYDYWTDRVRRPLLVDSGADYLVRGMGEEPLIELLRALSERGAAEQAAWLARVQAIPGLCWRTPAREAPPADALDLADADTLDADRRAFAAMHHLVETHLTARFTQKAGGQRIVANPPAAPLTPAALDALYRLPFTREVHPVHGTAAVPALEQVRFSLVAHRGCAGGCAFCAIGLHQGRRLVSRPEAGLLDELRRLAAHPDFHGTCPDIGGPSANMYGYACDNPAPCARVSCLWPARCPHFRGDGERYRALLAAARAVPNVRHVFVTSGLRLELFADSPALLADLARHHVSGRIKVAPEHLADEVLTAMRKPAGRTFARFVESFRRVAPEHGKGQQVWPYFMAAHPGCTLDHMIALALQMKRLGIRAEQCQLFTPTPGTAATAMYASGLDPRTLAPVFVERDETRRAWQKALILYHDPAQAPLIRQALVAVRRTDLLPLLLPSSPRRR